MQSPLPFADTFALQARISELEAIIADYEAGTLDHDLTRYEALREAVTGIAKSAPPPIAGMLRAALAEVAL